MSEAVELHDPNSASVPYSLDWTDYLDTLTISSSSWAISPSGPTINGSATASPITTIRVTGGTLGQIYQLTNTVTFSDGSTDDRSITLRAWNQ